MIRSLNYRDTIDTLLKCFLTIICVQEPFFSLNKLQIRIVHHKLSQCYLQFMLYVLLCSCKNNSWTFQLALKPCNFLHQTSCLEKYNFIKGTIVLYQGKPQPNEDSLHITSRKYFITQESTKNTCQASKCLYVQQQSTIINENS